MKIGFCQFDVTYREIEKNLQTVESMLQGVNADLIVLPELALTGYYFDDKDALIKLTNQQIELGAFTRLQAVAKKEQMTIMIGLSEVDNNKLYNSVYLIDKTGVIGKTRKRHLTMNEKLFDVGESIDLFEVKGVKIGIAICFDTWFPELFRVLAEKGADVICCPANFGGPYTLDVVKVRALENSIPVVLSNRLGYEKIQGYDEYFRGESCIIDGYGNRLVAAGDAPYIGIYDIDLKAYSRNKSLICDSMNQEKAKYK